MAECGLNLSGSDRKKYRGTVNKVTNFRFA
jgi:hypothetical protein